MGKREFYRKYNYLILNVYWYVCVNVHNGRLHCYGLIEYSAQEKWHKVDYF